MSLASTIFVLFAKQRDRVTTAPTMYRFLALKGFQKSVGIRATSYLGPITSRYIVSGKQGAFYSNRQNAISCRDE